MKGDGWIGRWAGRTVVCVASGPSLTPDDCELVRQSGHPTIVCNTTFRLCPWADVLFAFDGAWLEAYTAEVHATFSGVVVSQSSEAKRYGAESLYQKQWFKAFGISGASAVSLAVVGGASKCVLLGYDAQKTTDGRSHWHDPHPKDLTDVLSIATWPEKFVQLAAYARKQNCTVVNASRETALKCFLRVELAAAL